MAIKLRQHISPRKTTHRVGWTLLVLLALILLVGALGFAGVGANAPSLVDAHVQELVGTLKESTLTPARHRAQAELEQMGPRAVPPLAAALQSNNVTLRRNAADMLGYIAAPEAIPALQGALKDTDLQVRQNAALSLGNIADFSSLNVLDQIAVTDADQQVRDAALASVEQIRERLAHAAWVDPDSMGAYAAAPSNGQWLYVTTRRDLLTSQDGGKTWQTQAQVLPSLARVLAVSPSDPNVLYASADALGMFKSMDGGATWTAVNNGLQATPGAMYTITAIGVDPKDPQSLFINTGVWLGSTQVNFHSLGLMHSVDGGETWHPLATRPQTEPITLMAVKDNQLYVRAGNQVLIYALFGA